MNEMLFSGGAGIPQPTGDVLFLYDPGTSKDEISGNVCIALSGGAAVDNTFLIDNKATLKFTAAGQQGLITFPTSINLEALTEWTVEWSSRPTTFLTSYVTELFMDLTVSQGYPIGCRWGDGGYGNRLQFNISNWANNNIGQPPIVKTDVTNKINRWAMVFKGGQLRIYKDGVKQLLAFGTSNTYAQDYIGKTQAFPTVTRMYLGYFNSVNQAFAGNMGRIRISNFARYLGNYTPVAF